jgi:carboxymethylenebutenolidase
MRDHRARLTLSLVVILGMSATLPAAEIVSFPSGSLTLHGVVYKPDGAGPFPALLYNHGSARDSSAASDALGPIFASHGWVFFMPSRRGQGLSSAAGPYISDTIRDAGKKGGLEVAASTMVRLLKTEHLDDQLAALAWLRKQEYVRPMQIAAAGNSFGGIETLLGAERGQYCAGVDVSGGAESWKRAPALQQLMISAVRNIHVPIFFLQPQNDFDLSPSKVLSATMKDSHEPFQLKIYPPFGASREEGHSFAYRGASVWAPDALEFLLRSCAKAHHR